MIEVLAVQVSLGKTLNPKLLSVGLAAPCMAAAAQWCISVCVNGCMRGHCKALWGTLMELESYRTVQSIYHFANKRTNHSESSTLQISMIPPFIQWWKKYQPVRTGHLG